MNAAETRAFLESRLRIILVTNGVKAYPHPVPMSFILDNRQRILMSTFRKSQKVRNLQRDPRASLLVESGIRYDELASVLMYADAEIIDELEAVAEVTEKMMDKEERLTGQRPESELEQARTTFAKRVVLRFTPNAMVSWDHGKLAGRY